MDLPKEIYQLLGHYVLSFPDLNNLNKSEQSILKKNLATYLVAYFPEYIDYILENYKIPLFNDLRHYCNIARENFKRVAEESIQKYRLEEYRDVIMENYCLQIDNLINIANFCFSRTNDFSYTCKIYCQLGYPGFENGSLREHHIINLIHSWGNFAYDKGYDRKFAQYWLICEFDEIDSTYGESFSLKDNKGILDFFPFSRENVEKLVDFTLNNDDFDSDFYKEKIGIVTSDGNAYIDIEPRLSLLCNYYVYIINKVNEQYPTASFSVTVFTKWLELNLPVISCYIPELPLSEIKALISDFSLDKFNDESPFKWDNGDLIENLYKLYYKVQISNYELAELWVYTVINKVLTYSNHKFQETAPILKVAETEYSEDGNILLPWKYVRFVDGKAFFYHPNHEKGVNGTLPFIYESQKVKKRFMDLNKSILWNFPFINCTTEKGKIIDIDMDFAEYVISEIDNLYSVLIAQKIPLSSSSVTAKDILLKYKSKQFDFLQRKQLRSYTIVPIVEKTNNSSLSKEEPSLLFTIGKNDSTMTLAYENASTSKASYIFIINKNCYATALTLISNYFTSNKINKRAELQYSRDMFNKEDGFLRVIRVLHNDSDNWETTINFYAKN